MSVEIKEIVSKLDPRKTVLLFGAGASIPSGGPSTATVIERIEREFEIGSGYSLTEISGIAEGKADRRKLVMLLRSMMLNLKPSGGLRNIPLFPWKSIFTTNYDQLVENDSQHKLACKVYSSNFDFTLDEEVPDVELFKLHGTIDKDICDGHASRIIISDLDYQHTEIYRQKLAPLLACGETVSVRNL